MSFHETEMSTLVLYDWDRRLSGNEVLALTEAVCALTGEIPEKMFIGHSDRRERVVRYETGRKRIKDGICEDYAYISAVRLFEAKNVRDLSLSVGINDSRKRAFEVCYQRSLNLDSQNRKIVEVFCSFATPTYGIYYTMPFACGPLYYALGIGKYGAPEWLQENVGKFSSAWKDGKLSKGKFREVYPFNVLSPAHLDVRVDNIRFEDWVIRGGHGRLSLLEQNVWIWEVEKSELERVRLAMGRSGVLI